MRTLGLLLFFACWLALVAQLWIGWPGVLPPLRLTPLVLLLAPLVGLLQWWSLLKPDKPGKGRRKP